MEDINKNLNVTISLFANIDESVTLLNDLECHLF